MIVQTERITPPRPKGKVELRHEAEYRRTLIALYVATDADDLGWTWVRDTRLAKETGLSTKAVKRSLEEMERRGIITTFAAGFGRRKRIIVFNDHRDATEVFEDIKNNTY